jgi:hypothetical protein
MKDRWMFALSDPVKSLSSPCQHLGAILCAEHHTHQDDKTMGRGRGGSGRGGSGRGSGGSGGSRGRGKDRGKEKPARERVKWECESDVPLEQQGPLTVHRQLYPIDFAMWVSTLWLLRHVCLSLCCVCVCVCV